MTDIEFIGIAATQEVSETTGPNQVDGIAAQTEAGSPVGAVVNPDYVEALARAHEGSGFDRVLIAHSSAMPDGFVVADQILSRTERLGVLLAHRPGFLAPTLAARSYATLDAFHPGRVAMHVITGGDDADQQRDGDFADKATRYAPHRRLPDRGAPGVGVGDAVRPRGRLLPGEGRLVVGPPGHPDPGLLRRRVRGRHPGRRQARRRLRVLGRAARGHPRADPPGPGGRGAVRPRHHGSASASGRSWPTPRRRPGPAPRRSWPRPSSAGTPPAGRFGLDSKNAVGSQRLLEYAAEGDVHDKRLWTAIAKVTGATGNSTALVGSYEQVAESLLDYVDLGVSTLLIRGFDPLADAYRYGRLIDLVRAGAAGRRHRLRARLSTAEPTERHRDDQHPHPAGHHRPAGPPPGRDPRHDRHPRRLREPARLRPGHRPGLHAPLRPRPRGGRLRPDPHRLRVELARGHPGRRPRGRAHRAPRPARGPPTRLRRADAGLPHLRHPRPVLRRPGGRAHHHRRPRRRAAPRRRLPRPRRALRPHRRVPHHPPPRVDLVRALRLRGPALPLRGLRARRAARTATGTCRCSSAARRRRRTGSAASTRTRSCSGASRSPRPPSRSRRCRPPPRPPAGRRRGSACRSARSSRRPRSSPGSGRTGSSTGSRTGPGCRSCRSASLPEPRRTRARGGCSAAAEKGDLHDRALWTPTATAAGAGGNTTALVGSPETVAAAILDYVEIGVDTVLIRGYDPLDDAVDYGRYVIPLVRQELAGRGR